MPVYNSGVIGVLLRHPSLRLAASLIALAAFGIVFVGVLPSPDTIGRWLGARFVEVERYPCESHACGCASARECWHECCCYTHQQRLVWAIRNGVTPPESVPVTEAEWMDAANDVQPGSATCWMCVDALLDELARGIGRAPACGSCEDRADGDHDGGGCCGGLQAATISPAGCKGLVSLIVLTLPPARWTGAMSWEFDFAESASWGDVQAHVVVPSRSLETPTPPPRGPTVPVINV